MTPSGLRRALSKHMTICVINRMLFYYKLPSNSHLIFTVREQIDSFEIMCVGKFIFLGRKRSIAKVFAV